MITYNLMNPEAIFETLVGLNMLDEVKYEGKVGSM